MLITHWVNPPWVQCWAAVCSRFGFRMQWQRWVCTSCPCVCHLTSFASKFMGLISWFPRWWGSTKKWSGVQWNWPDIRIPKPPSHVTHRKKGFGPKQNHAQKPFVKFSTSNQIITEGKPVMGWKEVLWENRTQLRGKETEFREGRWAP